MDGWIHLFISIVQVEFTAFDSSDFIGLESSSACHTVFCTTDTNFENDVFMIIFPSTLSNHIHS